MKPQQIELHVERIALAAMPAGGERRLRETLKRELVRLAGEANNGARWPARARETGQPHDPSGGRGAEAMARRIARRLHSGLSEEAVS